jgi:hypothetical protein
MPHKKEHSVQIVALAYITGMCGILVLAGLYLVFAKDRLEAARWYASAAKIYTEQAYQSANIKTKNELLSAAKESQRRAVRAQPFDVTLWQGMVDILQHAHENTAPAKEITRMLGAGEKNP